MGCRAFDGEGVVSLRALCAVSHCLLVTEDDALFTGGFGTMGALCNGEVRLQPHSHTATQPHSHTAVMQPAPLCSSSVPVRGRC
jgi:hypothetical protein